MVKRWYRPGFYLIGVFSICSGCSTLQPLIKDKYVLDDLAEDKLKNFYKTTVKPDLSEMTLHVLGLADENGDGIITRQDADRAIDMMRPKFGRAYKDVMAMGRDETSEEIKTETAAVTPQAKDQ